MTKRHERLATLRAWLIDLRFSLVHQPVPDLARAVAHTMRRRFR